MPRPCHAVPYRLIFAEHSGMMAADCYRSLCRTFRFQPSSIHHRSRHLLLRILFPQAGHGPTEAALLMHIAQLYLVKAQQHNAAGSRTDAHNVRPHMVPQHLPDIFCLHCIQLEPLQFIPCSCSDVACRALLSSTCSFTSIRKAPLFD